MASAIISNFVSTASTTFELRLSDAIHQAATPFTEDKTQTGSGSKFRLKTPAVNNSAATKYLSFIWHVPAGYVANSTITVTLTGHVDVVPNVSKTIDLEAWKMAVSDGTVGGADLCGTAAQALTNASADYAFTLTTPTLSPGDRILFNVAVALDDTGGSGDKFGFVSRIRGSSTFYGALSATGV